LINSLEDIKNSMNEVLKKNNLPTHDSKTYQYFIGEGIKLLVKRSLPKNLHDPENLSKFHNDYKIEYKKKCLDFTKPYPDIIKMLKVLNSKNIPISVISNKSDELTKHLTKILFNDIKFEYVVGQKDNGPKKPDPSSAIEISKQLNIHPNKFLFIGDTTVDIETAKNAQMRSIAVSWGFRKVEELKNSSKIIQNPLDILELDELKY